MLPGCAPARRAPALAPSRRSIRRSVRPKRAPRARDCRTGDCRRRCEEMPASECDRGTRPRRRKSNRGASTGSSAIRSGVARAAERFDARAQARAATRHRAATAQVPSATSVRPPRGGAQHEGRRADRRPRPRVDVDVQAHPIRRGAARRESVSALPGEGAAARARLQPGSRPRAAEEERQRWPARSARMPATSRAKRRSDSVSRNCHQITRAAGPAIPPGRPTLVYPASAGLRGASLSLAMLWSTASSRGGARRVTSASANRLRNARACAITIS